jgi:uncharacterized protein (DUF1697 family)
LKIRQEATILPQQLSYGNAIARRTVKLHERRGILALAMAVIISMLRAVNVGGHNKIKMDALRALYESLGFRDVQSYVQSGNVVFRTKERDLHALTTRIQDRIEKRFGFRPGVVLRTRSELGDVIRRNPFAKRRDIEPNKFLVTFLASEPDAEALDKARTIKTAPEEVKFDGREVFIYFPNGMARPKISLPAIERALGTSGTGRNWNSVNKLLEIAEKMEASE